MDNFNKDNDCDDYKIRIRILKEKFPSLDEHSEFSDVKSQYENLFSNLKSQYENLLKLSHKKLSLDRIESICKEYNLIPTKLLTLEDNIDDIEKELNTMEKRVFIHYIITAISVVNQRTDTFTPLLDKCLELNPELDLKNIININQK